MGAGEDRAASATDPGRRDGPGDKAPAGGIYYWPDTATLAVYYDDLGQSVPPPGLIRLGTVDTGVVDEIAEAGGLFTVRIDEPIT